jgi:hypothetical protein
VTDRSFERQADIVRYLALVGLLLFAVSYSFDWKAGYIILAGLVTVVFLWSSVLRTEEEARAEAERERVYASMTDDEKIEHHLVRARYYGTNHDANIAQALIERNKK